MAVGIYTSTYKRHYIWPPHIPRKTASIENPTYPDLCGKGEPTCDCKGEVCFCGGQGKEVLPACELDSWRYLKGVKTQYGDSYDKPVKLQPLKRRFKGPDAGAEDFDPPKSDFPNPFMLGKDVFRPELPRSLSGSCFPMGSEVPEPEAFPEPNMADLQRAMASPEGLQERILWAKAASDKIAMTRARPRKGW